MAKAVKSQKKVADIKEKKVNSILITQPRPESEKSPYFDLAKKYELKLDFHAFIRVEGLSAREFRKQKIELAEYSAIIFTSRNAVDHFFRICEEMKIKVSQEMKYFCITEAVALYLQKFILYRKRKVFFSPDGSTAGLLEVIGKHKHNEKFILPITDSAKNEIAQYLLKHNVRFAEAMLYRMVSNDVSSVMKSEYDMIVFFSPNSLQTLFEHKPDYKQFETLIGAFGPTTTKAVEEAGLRLDVKAPAANAPSMVSALELFFAERAKPKKTKKLQKTI